MVKFRKNYREHDRRFNFSGILLRSDWYQLIRRNIPEEMTQGNNAEEQTQSDNPEELTQHNNIKEYSDWQPRRIANLTTRRN